MNIHLLKRETQYKNYELLLKVFIGIGIFAAVLNYVNNRSLWIDEAMISLNIVTKSYASLLKPLDMNQVAPIGFLFIQKTFTSLLGNKDWVLRIFPFISYLLSILFLYKLSCLLFNSIEIIITICTIFTLNVLILYFSSEVKQYSSDVLVSLLVFYSTFYFNKMRNKNSLMILSIVGVIAPWFSNVGIVVLFTASIYLLYIRFKKENGINNKIFISILLWMISFIVYYALFIHNHPSKAYMINYWANCGSFLPTNVVSVDFYRFIYFKLGLIFNYMFRLRTYWLFGLITFVIGLLFCIIKRDKIVLLIFPLFIHFLLSALKLYPFDSRLILYQIPLIIIFFSKGMFVVYDFICKYLIKLPIYILLLPALLNIYSVFRQTPYQRQEVKKTIDYINKEIKDGESIYVYGKGIPAFKFYVNNYVNTKKSTVLYGTWKKTNMERLDKDIAMIKNNTWILFSNVYQINTWNDEKYFMDELKKKGFNINIYKSFVGSSCYKVTQN